MKTMEEFIASHQLALKCQRVDHRTDGLLTPVQFNGFTFTIEPCEALSTYILRANGAALAMHPNGFSLKELVTRMQAGIWDRIEAQWDYILACGGLAKSKTALSYYMGRL